LAALGSLVITIIEWLKQVIWPGISTWESHVITIMITTSIILVAARIIYRFAQLHSEAQSLMASIVESSDDGIIGQTLDGTIVSWNRGAEGLLGYSAEEARGKSVSIIIPPDHKDELSGIIEKIRKGEHIENYETVRLDKAGRRIDVSVTISPITSDSGGIIGASAIIRDISERKIAQEELRKSNEQLRDLYRRLQSAREEERTRIAREIHDEFGQTLTALKIDLAWINKRLLKEQVPVNQKIESMSTTIGMAIGSIKKLTADLRPGILDDFGLIAAIEWQAEEFESRTGTRCKLTLDMGGININEEVSTTVFRILQEALTNIMRHAEAKNVELQLMEEDGILVFTIRDDGKGMRRDETFGTHSFGLLGIRERAAALGGFVDNTSSPGEGTVICARIPLENAGRVYS
ncbi:MAG: PAS domain S-box protein, partial [Desulfobacteraceae bacterium]|nr:PAS domain S-box protein [Desulfobacteraceae bacterium]